MAKEYPASKTQIGKAAELGIDTSDRPGYTTLGARLEAAGWAKDGKTQLEATSPLVATDHLAALANRKTDYERRQERKANRPQPGDLYRAAMREDRYGDQESLPGEGRE